ncbi:SMP-30/gluconolactonase/LRE family protein [Marinomonas sp. 15G1-11]|uniref:SMP-30/gluconolactonase/LRE family protein n=1 Tax=Marinomonas phaeophyticola TaxID=3004091 RepID=A0ABT4JYZ7_9GAMM|nr:SMP-30/gluconolactonase/LRE family protein [Marinomonas sp. 15G1-11]MCZ2723493.1 SMP-30/gluconolactonase/LRE family protein [Marinomonas sp. 15G1-11]
MPNVQCLIDAQAKLAECPRWDEKTDTLYYVDIDSFQLCRFNLSTDTLETRQFDEEIGCFSLTESGGFIAAFRSGVYTFTDFNSELMPYWIANYDRQTTRFNDGRCDFNGRFLAGTMYSPKDAFKGALHQFSNGDHTVLDQSAWTSNGLAFSPDGKTMYYSDTPNHVVYTFDYDMDTGKASNKKVFIEFPRGLGRPDGAAVDTDGNYWSALYAGQRIVKISPQGDILEEFPIPAIYPTMVAFGGPQMKTLFVSTCRAAHSEEELDTYPQAGGIFALETSATGLIEPRFKN